MYSTSNAKKAIKPLPMANSVQQNDAKFIYSQIKLNCFMNLNEKQNVWNAVVSCDVRDLIAYILRSE